MQRLGALLALVFVLFTKMQLSSSTSIEKDSKSFPSSFESGKFLLQNDSRLYSQYDERLSKRLLIYATISYCSNETMINTWTCSACYDDEHFTITHAFKDDDTDIYGYLGWTKMGEKHSIVMAFRGTKPTDLKNVYLDMRFWKMYADQIAPGAQVHRGFYEAWSNLSKNVISALEDLYTFFGQVGGQCDPSFPANPDIYLIGHSLGGALATVAAADLISSGIVNPRKNAVHLFTYGSPRVGNDVMANYLVSVLSESWRMIHNEDPVPSVPPHFLGFQHVPNAVLYNSDSTSYVVCTKDGENRTCGVWLPINVFDHISYMNISVGHYCDSTPIPPGAKHLIDKPIPCSAFGFQFSWNLPFFSFFFVLFLGNLRSVQTTKNKESAG